MANRLDDVLISNPTLDDLPPGHPARKGKRMINNKPYCAPSNEFFAKAPYLHPVNHHIWGIEEVVPPWSWPNINIREARKVPFNYYPTMAVTAPGRYCLGEPAIFTEILLRDDGTLNLGKCLAHRAQWKRDQCNQDKTPLPALPGTKKPKLGHQAQATQNPEQAVSDSTSSRQTLVAGASAARMPRPPSPRGGRDIIPSSSTSRPIASTRPVNMTNAQKKKALADKVRQTAKENKALAKKMKALASKIKETTEENKALAYEIKETAEKNKALAYEIKETAEKNKALAYEIKETAEENKALAYEIRETAEENKVLAKKIKVLDNQLKKAVKQNKALTEALAQATEDADSERD